MIVENQLIPGAACPGQWLGTSPLLLRKSGIREVPEPGDHDLGEMLVAGAYLAHHCVFCLLQLLLKTQHSPVIIVTIRGLHLFCRYAPPVHIFSPTCPYPQSPPERFLLSDQLTRYHRQPGKHFIPFIRHRHHHDHLNKQLVDDIQLFTDCLDNQRIHRTCRHTLHASIATGVDGEEDGGGMKMVRMVRKIGRG